MRDYRYDEEGKDPGIAVADLPTPMIEDLLRDGFQANSEASEEAIRERLRLELHIRSLGLRL